MISGSLERSNNQDKSKLDSLREREFYTVNNSLKKFEELGVYESAQASSNSRFSKSELDDQEGTLDIDENTAIDDLPIKRKIRST